MPTGGMAKASRSCFRPATGQHPKIGELKKNGKSGFFFAENNSMLISFSKKLVTEKVDNKKCQNLSTMHACL